MSDDTGGGGGLGGGGAPGGGGRSWAALLGSSLPSTLNKNILEIVLEKDERGAFVVSEADCARLMRKLGLDQRPGVQVEGVQICPNGRGVILITLKNEVKIDRFCRYEAFEVTNTGIRSVLVKPAGKREVVVSLKGIHPNTRDDGVLDYLAKFAKVVTTKVVYGTFSEGPLKGMRNGDRSYKLEIKPGMNIGSYHVIDGQKVALRYHGQQQTCGRCHQTSQTCKGKGVARKCEAEGGVRIEFNDYILDLWRKVGYNPSNVQLPEDINAEVDDKQELEAFTPVKAPTEVKDNFNGVTVKQFPKNTDDGDIMEFLVTAGLPEDKKNSVNIKTNGHVIIRDLEISECKVLIEAIHGKNNFGRKLFCNGIVPLTPLKSTIDQQSLESPTPEQNLPDPSTLPETSKLLEPSISDSDQQFVRRYSLSLLNRSPPAGSVAADILDTVAQTPIQALIQTKSIMDEFKGIKFSSERYSDFGSCVSDSSRSSGDDTDHNELDGGFKTMNERKRHYKTKRKKSLTPGKDSFLKKLNTTGASHNPAS